MEILFLGTAAAEGYPGLFCNCDHCREARALGGKNIRFRSALLVNDDLLIDFGPDLLAAALRFQRSLWGVKTGLVTHAHMDHFFMGNFNMREGAFTAHLPVPTLRLFGPREVAEALEQAYPDPTIANLEIHRVGPFETWRDGPYTFQSFKANHAVDHLEALFYSISDGTKSFLYATDTGPFYPETWDALNGLTFDMVILEETMGTGIYTQHIGFEAFLEHAQQLRARGILRPGGRMIAHHMSHSSNPTHEKIEAILGPHGVEVAYDGMLIKI